MNSATVALITAAGVTTVFVIVHMWQGRTFRGKHSFYERELSANTLIRMAEPSIELDKAAHRDLQDRLREHRQRRDRAAMPASSIDQPGRHHLREPHAGSATSLITGEQTLFCGAYGGPVPSPKLVRRDTDTAGLNASGIADNDMPSSRRATGPGHRDGVQVDAG
jgi:hypothetical protein